MPQKKNAKLQMTDRIVHHTTELYVGMKWSKTGLKYH